MIKTNKAGAIATLQDILTNLPADHDARSEFFHSWKNRVIQSLELIFQDDPQPCQQFKEIEFSPRRLTNNESRDDQLKLDAFLAGCAAARTLLESFLWRLSSADQPAPEPAAPILTVSRMPEAKAPAAQPAAPKPKPRPQPSAPAEPTTAPWVMVHPDHAPDPVANVKPLMAPDTVVLPPSPAQVEAHERKLAMEKAAREKAEREKAAREQAIREKLEREKAEQEKAEQERAAREQAERERIERENAKRQKAERAERERAEQEKADRERANREKVHREKAEREAERAERHRERAEREREKADKAHRAKPERPRPAREAADSPVIADASMNADELCSPVRGSLARMLNAWERGDRDTAAVVSAQLLADLSMLAHHDRFKAAFEHVVTRAFAPDVAQKTLDALKTSGPLCVWSMIAAMNEVMKA